MSKKVPVCFIKRMSPYQPGEVAGFEADEADRLIKAGIAEPYKVPKSKVSADSSKEGAGAQTAAPSPAPNGAGDQQGSGNGSTPQSGS